jgi:hypothetical protein
MVPKMVTTLYFQLILWVMFLGLIEGGIIKNSGKNIVRESGK